MRKGFRATARRPQPIKALDRYAETTLRVCAEQWDAASGLDTAVRDNVATGLAYLVWAAYDSIACSKNIGFSGDDYAAANAFTDGATAQWFRDRGFAEWYCIACGNLFHNQRPRTKAELPFLRIRRIPKRKKKVAA